MPEEEKQGKAPQGRPASPKKRPRKGTKKEALSLAVWKFPKNTLEESIRVASALEEKFAGNPTKAEDLVRAVGFNKTNDWRFKDLLKSAALYGINLGADR